jgi:SAM-dependent methyltransferase
LSVYAETAEALRSAYDRKVAEREAGEMQAWKAETRQGFLDLLREEGKFRLLEVGAGTGVHGLFFKNAGLEVVSTDLSQAMVEACRAKGLNALQLDFLSLDFEAEFDAVFSLNCFLHITPGDLPGVLAVIRRSLVPNGLLYWGQYGGVDHQGPLQNDNYEPKR